MWLFDVLTSDHVPGALGVNMTAFQCILVNKTLKEGRGTAPLSLTNDDMTSIVQICSKSIGRSVLGTGLPSLTVQLWVQTRKQRRRQRRVSIIVSIPRSQSLLMGLAELSETKCVSQ